MGNEAWKRRAQIQTQHRRRAHDVVMWQEMDEFVVYDGVKDECRRFDVSEEEEAIEHFKKVKAYQDQKNPDGVR